MQSVVDGSATYRWGVGILCTLLLFGMGGYTVRIEAKNKEQDQAVQAVSSELVRQRERLEDKLETLADQLNELNANQRVILFRLGVTTESGMPLLPYDEGVTEPQRGTL